MNRLLGVSAFASGFAVMGAELAAGRLLAPSFGTSTLVWSVLIGGVLAAMAIGSLLGGRWSSRPRALVEAFGAMAVAGALLAAAPALTRPLMRGTLAALADDRVLALALRLGAIVVLLATPVLLLGALTPVLTHHAPASRDDVGRAAGRIGALGTTGSLAGTFAAGLVLVPRLGTELTFRLCGAVVIAVGLFGVLSARRHRAIAAAGLTLAVPFLLAAPRARLGGPETILERETPYNYARVTEEEGLRRLYLNEGYAVQTVTRLDGRPWLSGVWGYYAAAPMLTTKRPSRVLVLGLGGGASARDYAERLPDAEIVAVEIDPELVAIARSHFGLPQRVRVHVGDARAFLAVAEGTYDLVVIDAFQFPYVPFQLTTREFFEDVHRHLRPGGAVMLNVGRKAHHLEIVHAVATTLGTVFRNVAGVNVRSATNSILVATDHGLEAVGGLENAHYPPEDVRALSALEPLAPWHVPTAARLVLTDDVAPVEWMTHRIILDELGLLPSAGGQGS